MNIKQQVRQVIEEKGYIHVNHFGEKSARVVRKALSELRAEGFITIPMNKNWTYFHADRVDSETLNGYYRSQLAHWKKQYFNTVLPISKEVKDNQLSELMGGMLDEL